MKGWMGKWVKESKLVTTSRVRLGLAVRVEAVDAMLDLCEDATGGIQLTNGNKRRYHLRSVDEAETVGVRLEKYKRLTVRAVDSSVGGLGGMQEGSLDLVVVGKSVGAREIAPCPPEHRWKAPKPSP